METWTQSKCRFVFPFRTWTVPAVLATAVLTAAGSAWAVGPESGLGEGRNHDARVQHNKSFAVQQSAAQLQAIDALRAEVPDLDVTFDETTGVTRTIYNQVGYLTGERRGEPLEIALDYVRSQLPALGLGAADVADFEVTDHVFSKVTGATHIYLRQLHQGLPVYNGQLHVNVNRDGRILSVNNAFLPDLPAAVRSDKPALAAEEAVASAAMSIGLRLREIPAVLQRQGDAVQTTSISGNGLSFDDIRAQLMWLPVRVGDARLVWNFQIRTLDSQHWYDFTVGADTGDVMTRFDWTNSGTYNVYEEPDESPLHGSTGRTLVVDPEDSTASPNGWFSGGTMDGNNVHACPDASPSNNVCDSNPQCSGTTCNFSINLNNQPSSYIPAAVTNLFYWNNLVHDVQYQYGFDEPGGNFQENNFGRGGNGSDSVNADAQDGGGNCNANFSTPTDGGNPRMQMYTCTNASPARDGDLDNGVIVHEYGHGISIRQVGGPGNSSCLNNNQQPGEGWSDWFGLVYTAENGDSGTNSRGIGTYLFGQAPNGPGIRDLPYSTNNSINNWTYASIGGASIPHGIGSRWAQGIWEVYWALVAKHGFSAGDDLIDPGPNWTGSQRALLYVNEGLKNTACSPTFIAARSGIVQAAADNFGGEDVCDVWEAFAAFGLGTNASTGGSNSTTATNGFNVPASCDDPPPPGCDNQLYSADFEGGGADGWTNDPSSTCSTGDFVAATPTQVTNGGVVTQPSGAAGGSGAWFTATNSSAGVNDVDGGTCDTRSPTVAVGAGSVTVNFDYFHGQRDQGGDSADGFVIDVLNGSGGVITTAVNIGDVTRNAAWTAGSATFSLGADTNVRLRVRATDGTASGDLVEGGIDNVQICGNDPGGPPPGGDCSVDIDFESGAAGWFNSGASTCSTGAYVLANPTQVVNGGVTTQVGGSNSGVNSVFTATNSSAGVNDVDGGNCILGSPTWSVGSSSTLSVAYWHGQRDTGGDANGDFFRLEYSLNGGSTWTVLRSNGDTTSNAVWNTATASIPAGSNVALRVQCSDGTASGDLVECGIDDVSICDN
jgi:extracellular elastinolytic metalloproteinase